MAAPPDISPAELALTFIPPALVVGILWPCIWSRPPGLDPRRTIRLDFELS